VTLGLMASFKRRGVTVQPFKCGPDFIDPGHHRRVCHRASRNLDGWMLSAEANRAIFLKHASSADVSVVEGVMGLFDGASRSSNSGSTAATATLLNLPSGGRLSSAEIDAAIAAQVAAGAPIYEVDAEQLAAFRPDLILTQGLCDVCALPARAVQRALGRLSPRPTILSLDARNIDGVLNSLRDIGAQTGHGREAEDRVLGYGLQLRQRERVSQQPPDSHRAPV
jgi:hypothetical protein